MDASDASNGRLPPLLERRLIERAQSGCADSAHRLVTSHQDRLNAFVFRMVRDSHEAEEICQEAFLRAFGSLDKFDFAYRFSTWLFTIGYRLSLNTLRRRREYSGDVDFGDVARNGRTAPAEDVADDVANSDEARRLKAAIWESVDRLTAPQRATVLLFYREALSCQDIGEILDMPAATVKSHLHRARARLRELLGEELVEGWSAVRIRDAAGCA